MNEAKLPIIEIFYESITLVKNNYLALINAALSYIIIALILNVYGFFNESAGNSDLSAPLLILMALSTFTFILASVKFHRIFLLNEVTSSLYSRWTLVESRFLMRWIVITLYMAIIMIPFLIIQLTLLTLNMEDPGPYLMEILIPLMMIPMHYFIIRLSLVLPATAIGEKENSIIWSWKLSKGNSIRLFLLLGTLPLMVIFIFNLFLSDDNILYNLSEIIMTILIMPFEICFLSLSYKFLMEANNQSEKIEKEDVSESFAGEMTNNQI